MLKKPKAFLVLELIENNVRLNQVTVTCLKHKVLNKGYPSLIPILSSVLSANYTCYVLGVLQGCDNRKFTA